MLVDIQVISTWIQIPINYTSELSENMKLLANVIWKRSNTCDICRKQLQLYAYVASNCFFFGHNHNNGTQ